MGRRRHRRQHAVATVERSASALPSGVSSDRLQDWFSATVGATPTQAGPIVTHRTAMRNAAVWACVTLIAETMATIPLDVYRRLPGGGKWPATDHYLYRLLHDRPNRWQTSVEWRELMFQWACLHGVGYSRIVREQARGEVVELHPLDPTRVTVLATRDGEVFYDTTDRFGKQRTLAADEMLAIRYKQRDLLTPISPIGEHRNTIGLSEACRGYGSRQFSQGAKISGFISFPNHESPQQMQLYSESISQNWHGESNQHKVPLIDRGPTFQRMGLSNTDAQFLEIMQFTLPEIARIYRCPLPLLQDLSHATFSNQEQQALAFVQHTIRPWCVRSEQALASLFEGELDVFPEFNVDGLLRGDINARYTAFARGIQWGFLKPSEAREMENLPPAEGADQLVMPANMALLAMAGQNLEPILSGQPA